MLRQSPNANQRWKEIKVKHVWQLCLLLAVCFWLIYQVKSSRDAKNVKASSLDSGHHNIFVELGRKGIHSRVEEMTVEENKHESGGTDGGDETFDAEENSVDGKREGEEGDKNGNGEKDLEDNDDHIEKESSLDETDHDGDDVRSHEAQYEADDDSRAASYEIRMASMKNENEDENSDEKIDNILEHGFEENTSKETDEGEKRNELGVEVGETFDDEAESNETTNESNKGSNRRSESELDSIPEIPTEDASAEDLNQQDTDFEKANYSTLNVDDNHLDSESTGPAETKISESEGTENLEEIQQDSIDSSDSSDEKDTEDVGTDLDTDGRNSEDAAAA